MPEAEEDAAAAPRSFWSGTITFGLVSIPVELFAAHRSSRTHLRMLAPDGTPLRRVYVCPRTGEQVPREELVRGYEVEAGRFVAVTDEELESLAPEKSRDIVLSGFVARASLPPSHFRRAYYLAPSGRSVRAYAVLADAMERGERAGIATFVMRGKEHLVAILADGGILRAQTLRFSSEVRSARDAGLPERGREPSREAVARMARAIERLSSDAIPLAPLRDERAEAIEALAREKHERREDVIEIRPEREEDATAEAPDLLALLKRRLRADADLESEPLSALRERARDLGIEGRSRMRKDALVRAIREADAA